MSMVVLVSAWGTMGEHMPAAALCNLLRSQGMDVHVLASDGHRDQYDVADERFHGLRSISLWTNMPPNLDLTGGVVRHFVDPLVPVQFETARNVIKKHGVDLLLSSWIMPGVIAAAQTAGVPVVPLHLYPMSIMAEDDLPVLTRWPRLTAKCRYPASSASLKQAILRYYRALSPKLIELRSAYGLSDDDGLLPGSGGPGLALFPRSLFRGKATHVFAPLPRSKPKALPADIEAFIRDGSPPLLIFRGTSFLDKMTTQSVASALSSLGQRCIVVWGNDRIPQARTPSRLDLGRYPVVDLLPQVAAVVHHGGINISSEVLAAGKPSLVIPYGGDQYDNACRLQDLGAAIQLPARNLTTERLRSALCTLLDANAASKMAGLAAGLMKQTPDHAAVVSLLHRAQRRRSA